MENIFKLLDYRKDDPINLDNKVKKFINWCKKNMKKKSYADEINELIDDIATWYELRYPNDEITRIFSESGSEQSYANEVAFKNNPYVNELCDKNSDFRELDWSDFFNYNMFIELLPWTKEYYLFEPINRLLWKPNPDLEETKDIRSTNKFSLLGEAILDCAMYRIIERGRNRKGPRRALLFAKEFERDINIPMKYGVDRSDPYLKTFIHKYLDAGGSRKLVCYEDYFYSTFRLSAPNCVTIKELLKREKPPYYTPQEHELHQRLVNALLNAKGDGDSHTVKQLLLVDKSREE